MQTGPVSTKNPRVAIVEDNPDLANYFIRVISKVPDLDLCGVAHSIAEGRVLLASRPDLMLLDLGLPDGSGIDLIPDIKEKSDARILVVTSFGDNKTVVDAIRAGAHGYILKDSELEDILDDIRVTLEGGSPISASVAMYLLEQVRTQKEPDAPPVEAEFSLSKRELDLLNCFARGLTYKETAEALELSPLTVGSYVKNIYRKLEVNSRGEAVFEALKTGQLEI